MWRPEPVGVVEDFGGMAGVPMVDVAAADGLMLFPRSVSFRM